MVDYRIQLISEIHSILPSSTHLSPQRTRLFLDSITVCLVRILHSTQELWSDESDNIFADESDNIFCRHWVSQHSSSSRRTLKETSHSRWNCRRYLRVWRLVFISCSTIITEDSSGGLSREASAHHSVLGDSQVRASKLYGRQSIYSR